MSQESRNLRRRQLDRRFGKEFRSLFLQNPPTGWIREIRSALGMTYAQLARRLGVSPQTVQASERSEARGAITLNRLRAAADAMNCDLVYMLVPRTTLDAFVNGEALRVAEVEVGRVAHSMALEAQSGRASERQLMVRERASDLVRKAIKRIWDEE